MFKLFFFCLVLAFVGMGAHAAVSTINSRLHSYGSAPVVVVGHGGGGLGGGGLGGDGLEGGIGGGKGIGLGGGIGGHGGW